MTQTEKMEFVLELAKEAIIKGELPIAAAIYNGDELVSSAYTIGCANVMHSVI